jgi:ribonuclease HI
MDEPTVLTVNIDGAARGNPGPAAFAYVIARDGEPLIEEAGRLGTASNTVAEYTALVRALERALSLGGQCVVIRSDSELLVKQMNGQYKVKNARLRELYDQAKELCEHFTSVSIQHVPREQNSHADRLCNEVLDGVRESASRAKPTPDAKAEGGKAIRQPQSPDRARKSAAESPALQYLRWVAQVWSQGKTDVLSVEEVWEQLNRLLGKQPPSAHD